MCYKSYTINGWSFEEHLICMFNWQQIWITTLVSTDGSRNRALRSLYFFLASTETLCLGFDKIYLVNWMVCWPSTIQKLMFLTFISISFTILIGFSSGSNSLISKGIRRASGSDIWNFCRNDFTNIWIVKSSHDLNLNTLGDSKLHL